MNQIALFSGRAIFFLTLSESYDIVYVSLGRRYDMKRSMAQNSFMRSGSFFIKKYLTYRESCAIL